MAKSIGCIGCGAMGMALLEGFAKADPGVKLFCFDRVAEKMAAARGIGATACSNPLETAQKAEIIIMAVKPVNVPEVLGDIAQALTGGKMLVSIAAGYGLARLRNHAGSQAGVCRVMPTTTARVGKGVFAICFDPLTSDAATREEVVTLFSKLGLCVELAESSFPAFSALIGAGPAYVFEMLAALCQAGVTLGFPASVSRKMLLELVGGCVALASQDKASFMDLRDNVCSPGGLTIAAVNRLDRDGFTGLVVEAVEAADRRAQEMEN